MPKAELQILICTNERESDHPKPSCGGLHDGMDLYRRFKDVVRARGLRESVLVTRTGCLHRCSHGAVVSVWPANHTYARVEVADVEELLEHEVSGAPEAIPRLAIADGDWE